MKKSTFQFFLIHYLTYCTVINISQGEALIGSRIRDAESHELPSVVSIGKRSAFTFDLENVQFCTGTMVTFQHVLTAAHCLYGLKPNETVVIAGNSNLYHGKQYAVFNWTTYDQWQFGYHIDVAQYSYNDLAIMMLVKAVTNPHILPAKVLKFVCQDVYESKLRIAGWGSSEDGQSPKRLKTATVRAMANSKCQNIIEALTNQTSPISEQFFCTRADPYVLSTCGDSGAPLFNKQDQLVGINLGSCPPKQQLCSYSTEFVCQNQVNLHLHLHHYRHFIICLTHKEEECTLAKRLLKKGC